MEDLRVILQNIETDLDAGIYQPGPWVAFLRQAACHPLHERAALAEDVSRVSNKLHLRTGRRTLPLRTGILLELAATACGVLLLRSGLRRASHAAVLAATFILASTFQPLIKTSVGRVLGIGYSYAYVQHREPKFKMRYGDYLAAPRWKRIVLHISGTVGSPLALWLVAARAEPELATSATVCKALFWPLTGLQVFLFLAGLAGSQRLGRLYIVRGTSGGAAGAELRAALMELDRP